MEMTIYIYPPPCPQGTQWCGHNVLDVPAPMLRSSGGGRGTPIEGLLGDPPPPGLYGLHGFWSYSRDFLSVSQLLFFDRFFDPLRNVFFPILAPKTLPKWRPKSTKIDEKVVSTGLSKNVPHFDNIVLFFFVFRKKGDGHQTL